MYDEKQTGKLDRQHLELDTRSSSPTHIRLSSASSLAGTTVHLPWAITCRACALPIRCLRADLVNRTSTVQLCQT